MSWRDILNVRIQGWGLDVHVGGLGLLAVALVVVLAIVRSRHTGSWRVAKANFSFAGLGQVEIIPGDDVAKIAHNAWVELQTRKAAIPFDPDQDVIVEVYDSWYALFKELRTLAKNVSTSAERADNGAPLVAEVIVKVLNQGLRPHLTRYQARFRRWYSDELAQSAPGEAPQDVQRRFLEFDELVSDLSNVSIQLGLLSEELRKLAHERTPAWYSPLRLRRKGSKPIAQP